MITRSTISAPIGLVGAPCPEHKHAPSGAAPLPSVHSLGSSQTGSNEAPKFFHPQSPPARAGARGSGTLRQLLPTGSVPTDVSQPSALLSNHTRFPPSPPYRSEEFPTNWSGILEKHSSVSSSCAGHRRYELSHQKRHQEYPSQ